MLSRFSSRALSRAARRAPAPTSAVAPFRTAMTRAVVLEEKHKLNIREIDIEEPFTVRYLCNDVM